MSDLAADLVERADLWQVVAARLRYLIVRGDLPAGEHLRELPLAQRFGVSRVPVREALIRLAHEGLVRGEPRRGAFVVGLSGDDIRELYDVRELLEVHAARLAAESATAEQIARLKSLLRDLNNESRSGDSEAVAAVDIAFHREVMNAAQHHRLLATWEPLTGIIQTLLTFTNEHSTKARILSAHRPLVDAIAKGDKAAAESATRKYLSQGLRNAERMWASRPG